MVNEQQIQFKALLNSNEFSNATIGKYSRNLSQLLQFDCVPSFSHHFSHLWCQIQVDDPCSPLKRQLLTMLLLSSEHSSNFRKSCCKTFLLSLIALAICSSLLSFYGEARMKLEVDRYFSKAQYGIYNFLWPTFLSNFLA